MKTIKEPKKTAYFKSTRNELKLELCMCLKTAYCKLTKQEVMFTHKHNQFNGHFHESQVPLPSLVQ